MGWKLKALIELFWFKYSQLQYAVKSGDDLLISILDREIDPVLTAIYEEKAGNVHDARMQFQFVLDLLRKEADDVSSVLRQREAPADAGRSLFLHRQQRDCRTILEIAASGCGPQGPGPTKGFSTRPS